MIKGRWPKLAQRFLETKNWGGLDVRPRASLSWRMILCDQWLWLAVGLDVWVCNDPVDRVLVNRNG